MDERLIERVAERERIVAWARAQSSVLERLSRAADKRGPAWAHIADSYARLGATYADVADAIERGDHLLSQEAGEGSGGRS